MKIPGPPFAPIPPATRLEPLPRPLLKDVYDRHRTDQDGDRADLSPAARSYATARALAEAVLGPAQGESSPEQQALERWLDRGADLSPAGIARFLLDGFAARAGADTAAAQAQALESLRHGAGDARRRLGDEGLLDARAAADVEHAVALAREGLERLDPFDGDAAA